jgi:hypothetical protein
MHVSLLNYADAPVSRLFQCRGTRLPVFSPIFLLFAPRNCVTVERPFCTRNSDVRIDRNGWPVPADAVIEQFPSRSGSFALLPFAKKANQWVLLGSTLLATNRVPPACPN